MLNAIGSSSYSRPAGTGTSIVGLEAQIGQYKIKLADWVNCPSCKTPEGKAKISDISNKISNIQARIEKITIAKLDAPIPGVQNNAAASVSAAATVGSRLDVFA